jgi:hypothetical protein
MFRYLLLVVTPALVTGCCFPNQWESIQHVVYASKEPNDSPRLYEVSMTIFKRCLCFICSSSAFLMRIFHPCCPSKCINLMHQTWSDEVMFIIYLGRVTTDQDTWTIVFVLGFCCCSFLWLLKFYNYYSKKQKTIYSLDYMK